jgi:hypothetical protein
MWKIEDGSRVMMCAVEELSLQCKMLSHRRGLQFHPREPHRKKTHVRKSSFPNVNPERTTNVEIAIQARPQVVISRRSSKKFGLHNDPSLRKIFRCKNPTAFRWVAAIILGPPDEQMRERSARWCASPRLFHRPLRVCSRRPPPSASSRCVFSVAMTA